MDSDVPLVVGEEGCTIKDVVGIFFKGANSGTVFNIWKNLAEELGIESHEIEKWRQDLLVDKLSIKDVFRFMLELWKQMQGKTATLANLIKHLKKVDSKNIGDELSEFFSTGKWVDKGQQLFKQTLPSKPLYYIPRTLMTRHVINAKVFSSTHKDIFVVDGIDKYVLSKLAGRELTDTSTKQVRKHELSVRFILLERFGDWALLCDKATNPIHLLKLQQGSFHWISTNGDISALQKSSDEKNQNELSEESFIREIEADVQFQTNQPICISDSPGMGKSLLLASIGRQLQQMHPQRCIAFIVISEYVVKVRELFPKFSNTEKAVLEALSQILCENDPAKNELVHKIKTFTEEPFTEVELMFDGFDEVSTDNVDLAHECLDTLTTKFNNAIRVWVTTRPQHLHELEKRFAVLGHNIQTFQEEHQIKFLTSFWNIEGKNTYGDKLEKYSKKCLSTLKEKLNKKDEDIAGIPLQCMMIAEVHMPDAHLFCDIKNERLEKSPEPAPSIDINSIADLYEAMIAFKIEKFMRTYPPQPQEIRHIWSLHMQLALELIFPSHAHKFKDTLQIEAGLDMDYLLNIGILERRGSATKDQAQFIHRTFAEYLSARFFAFNVIASGTADLKNASKNLPSFLFEHVLQYSVNKNEQKLLKKMFRTFMRPFDESDKTTYYKYSLRNSVLCHFLDVLLDSQATNYARNYISPKSTDSMKNVIYACIHSDFGNIIKFLHGLKYPDSFGMNYLSSRILIDASRVSSLELLKFLLQHFEHEPFTAVLQHCDKPKSALHAAVLRGNYLIFEYILKEKDFEDLVKEDERFLDLVYRTVKNTAGGDLDEIQDRVQIVTALCDLNREMINYGDDYNNETPLLADKVSIVLLKKLMDCGANLFHVDWRRYTILHTATKYLSPTDYYDLLQFIPIHTFISLLPMTNKNGETCFHLVAKHGLATPDILNRILSLGIDINIRDSFGRTCLFQALGMQNEEMILPTVKRLLERGADHKFVDFSGCSVVHYSAEIKRIDCLRFFLVEKNMNVNQINKNGQSPIFMAVSRSKKLAPAVECVQFLLDHGADYKILKSDGRNLLHHSAYWSQPKCLELFLSLGGLDINQVDINGDTPLLCAVFGNPGNTVEMTLLLLGKGADHTISNKKQENVLHRLAVQGDKELFSHFVRLPSLDVNAKDGNNDTPLHVLCQGFYIPFDLDSLLNQIELFELLLSLGADVNAKNKRGKTPLNIFESNIDKEDEDHKHVQTIRGLLGGK